MLTSFKCFKQHQPCINASSITLDRSDISDERVKTRQNKKEKKREEESRKKKKKKKKKYFLYKMGGGGGGGGHKKMTFPGIQ